MKTFSPVKSKYLLYINHHQNKNNEILQVVE